MFTPAQIRTAANRLFCEEFLPSLTDPERAIRLNEAMDDAVRQARRCEPRRDPLVDIFHEGRLQARAIRLSEALPDADDQADARDDLARHGDHHVGGGAAPHFVLRLHRREG